MSAAWFVILVILALWGVAAAVVVAVDVAARRHHREQLEVREWTEKVEAMRRIVDREGDA